MVQSSAELLWFQYVQFGVVLHLGFERRRIFTIPRPLGTASAPVYQISTQYRAMRSWRVGDSVNFHGLIFSGNFKSLISQTGDRPASNLERIYAPNEFFRFRIYGFISNESLQLDTGRKSTLNFHSLPPVKIRVGVYWRNAKCMSRGFNLSPWWNLDRGAAERARRFNTFSLPKFPKFTKSSSFSQMGDLRYTKFW